MTYPIRSVPDADTAWGPDIRAVIAGVNDHQTRVTTLETAVLSSSVRSASYTLVAADMGVEQVYNSATAGTFTVPTDASETITAGKSVPLHQFGAGQLTVAGAGGVTVSARGGALKLAGQYAVAELRKLGINTWLLYGDITT